MWFRNVEDFFSLGSRLKIPAPSEPAPPAQSTHYPEPRSGGGLKENRHVAEIKWYHVSYMMTLAGLPLEREHYPGDNIRTRPEHCCFSQLKKEALIHLNMSVYEYMATVSHLNMNYATLLNLGWLNVSVFDSFTVGPSGTQHPEAMNTFNMLSHGYTGSRWRAIYMQ